MKWYLNKILIQVNADASLSATIPSSCISSYLIPSYVQIQIIGTTNKRKGVQSVRENHVQWDTTSTPVTSTICSSVAQIWKSKGTTSEGWSEDPGNCSIICNNKVNHQENEIWTTGTERFTAVVSAESRKWVFSPGALSSFCCFHRMSTVRYLKCIWF